MAGARREQCRLHGRGDGAGAPRAPSPMTVVVGALRSAPARPSLAALLAAVPVGPLIALLPVARPLRARAAPAARRRPAAGARSSPPRSRCCSRASAASSAASPTSGCSRSVAPVAEEASKGLFLLLLLWWRRHELDGVLDGIVYAGMVGVGFAFTENILYLASAYDGSDGLGPGGVDALTGTFVAALPGQPVRPPALHRLHRHRRRHRGRLAGAGRRASWRRSPGTSLRRARPRRLEHLDRLRRRATSCPST